MINRWDCLRYYIKGIIDANMNKDVHECAKCILDEMNDIDSEIESFIASIPGEGEVVSNP